MRLAQAQAALAVLERIQVTAAEAVSFRCSHVFEFPRGHQVAEIVPREAECDRFRHCAAAFPQAVLSRALRPMPSRSPRRAARRRRSRSPGTGRFDATGCGDLGVGGHHEGPSLVNGEKMSEQSALDWR